MRDANLPVGLLVRLPRDPASGVALHVVTGDTRPVVSIFTIALLAGAAWIVYVCNALRGD